jgi:glycosyltransferase involved in cell wall biosynthesis
VAEGFGQVLLEALACGLPILSTTNTAAPDLIDDGIQGFVVEPKRPDLLAQRITWAFENPEQLAEMREAARRRAEQFTWARFRSGVVDAVTRFQAQHSQALHFQAPPGGHAKDVNQYV